MVTQINLGNFFTSGGKTVLAGSASGLDVESLIKTLTEARGLPATKLDDKIKVNDKRLEAYGELKTLLDRFRDASNFLRNPPGVSNATDNVFQYREANANSNTTTEGDNYVSISAAPGATVQSYLITEITSIAKATKQASNTLGVTTTTQSAVTSGVTAGFFKAGTITINGQNVTLAQGDSLQTVVAKFNAVKEETGITASIVQVDSTSFRVLWTANETGEDAEFDLNANPDADQVLNGLTITDQQLASNAEFIIDGITITRQSNTISDVIDDVTFTLNQVMDDGTTTVTASIEADTSVAKSGIINFINAYNDLKIFAAKQTKIEASGVFSEDAVLSSSTLLRNILGTVGGHISSLVNGLTGTAPSRLAELGITFADLPESDDNPFTRNILNLNEQKLDAMLAGDFDGVRRVFEFDFSFSNSNFTVFARTNNTTATEVDLDILPAPVAKIQTTDDFLIADADTAVVFTVPGEGQYEAGAITVNGQVITLVNGDTLNQVVQKFNDVSDDTGISAAVYSPVGGEFRIRFTATTAGSVGDFDLNSTSTVTSGIAHLSTVTTTTSQEAEDIHFQATVDSTTYDLTAGAIEGGGYRLEGADGSPLEGLVIIYGASDATTATLTMTQGIADRLWNTMDGILEDQTGTLAIELDSITDSSDRLQREIDRINEQVDKFREQLLNQFGRLDAAIANVNTLLTALDAQTKAAQNSN